MDKPKIVLKTPTPSNPSYQGESAICSSLDMGRVGVAWPDEQSKINSYAHSRGLRQPRLTIPPLFVTLLPCLAKPENSLLY